MESYGILNKTKHLDKQDEYLEELSINGFTVVQNILTEEELGIIRKKLGEVYEKQVKEFSEEKLVSIKEANLARCPMAYDDYFIELIKKEQLIQLVQQVLGNYFILHLQNGIINMPKQPHHQSSWHRDLPYQDFVISKPLALSALYCIDDFDEITGGTIVAPFTHKIDHMPSNQYLEKYSTQIIAKAGSVIVFDSMLFHKAGYNSSDRIRRGINHVFTAAILKQQINIPKFLGGKYKDDPFLSRVLAYETVPSESVKEWRTGRFKN